MLQIARITENTSLPLWIYCIRVWPLALIPGVIVVTSIVMLFGIFSVDTEQLAPKELNAPLEYVLIGAPILDTLHLAGLIQLLLFIIGRILFVAVVAGILAGLAHTGGKYMLWFFMPAWTFFIFSLIWIAWQKRSFGHAFGATAIVHFLCNLSVYIFIVSFSSV